ISHYREGVCAHLIRPHWLARQLGTTEFRREHERASRATLAELWLRNRRHSASCLRPSEAGVCGCVGDVQDAVGDAHGERSFGKKTSKGRFRSKKSRNGTPVPPTAKESVPESGQLNRQGANRACRASTWLDRGAPAPSSSKRNTGRPIS